jgi:hypothetical protein
VDSGIIEFTPYRAIDDICGRILRWTVSLDIGMPELPSRSIVDWSNLYISFPLEWSIDRATASESPPGCNKFKQTIVADGRAELERVANHNDMLDRLDQ